MKAIIALALGISILVFQNCSGTRVGDSSFEKLNIYFSSYNQVSSMGSPLFISKAYAQVSDITFCIKKIRFKPDSSSSEDDETFEFNLGEVSLTNTGTQLDAVTVPHNTYKRVEIDLSNDCSSGFSVQTTNDSGNFNTDDSVTIKFDGDLALSGSENNLFLNVQQLVNALDTVTNNDDIKGALESISGSIE